MANNVFDNLRKEIQDDLLQKSREYPTSITDLIVTLQETHLWSELPISAIRLLYSLNDAGLGSLSIYDIYYGESVKCPSQKHI